MTHKHGFFGWVKVTKKGEPHLGLPCEKDTPHCLLIRSGDRPPVVAALGGGSNLQSLTLSGDAYPPGVYECCDAGSRTLFGQIELHGEWTVDKTFKGSDGMVFDFAQFIGSRVQAVQWLMSPVGRHWKGIAPVALMCFVPPTGYPLDAETSVLDGSSTREARGDACPRFAPDDWARHYRALLTAPTSLFDAAALQQLVDEAYEALRPKSDAKNECAEVAKRTREQSSKQTAIRNQADTTDAMLYVAFGHGDPFSKPATLALLDALRQGLVRPIFELKARFSHGRPWTCCMPELPLALDKLDALFPHHPSYPAGHASFVFTLAQLLGEVLVAHKSELLARAKEVADNRIVAGFHFPADNVAGQVLATLIVDKIRSSPSIAPLLKQIPAEWQQRS